MGAATVQAGNEAEAAGLLGGADGGLVGGGFHLSGSRAGGIGSARRLGADEDLGHAGVGIVGGDPEDGMEAAGLVENLGRGGTIEAVAGDERVTALAQGRRRLAPELALGVVGEQQGFAVEGGKSEQEQTGTLLHCQ